MFLLGAALALASCTRRPDLIYVNERASHVHDLALELSISMASKKADAEFALVQKKELPAGKDPKAYANELFHELRIGERYHGRGVLILYSEKENVVKIEVSYLLEPVLTDIACRGLERAAATYFLSDLSQDFFSELLITLSNAVREQRTPDEDMAASWPSKFLSGGAGVLGTLGTRSAAEILEAVRRLPGESLAAYVPSDEPRETLRRYLDSLSGGVGDPRLPLLTPGSKVFRLVVPRSVGQILRISRDYRKAGLNDFFQKENFALATFAPGSSTLPIVLRRDRDGHWLVDEVKSWTYFHRFENSPDFYLLTDDNPFRPDLRRRGWSRAECTIFKARFPLPPTRFDPQPEGGAALADWYLFETGWFARARDLYRADASPESRWKLFHVLINLSEAEPALDVLETLYEDAYARREYADRELHEWYFQYRAEYLRAERQFTAGAWDALNIDGRIALLAARKWWRDFLHYGNVHDRCLPGT